MGADSVVTDAFLDVVRAHSVTSSELLEGVTEADLLNSYYGADEGVRFLSRPLFLEQSCLSRLMADLDSLYEALTALPDRAYGGDVAAFGKAVGLTDVQVSAALRSRGTSVSRQGRADLCASPAGFRLMEFNLNSALGGRDNAELCRALLDHPLLREFAEEHHLGYVDTMREEIRNLRSETGWEGNESPVVAMVDWPSSYLSLSPYLRAYCDRLRELGLDVRPCHLGQLVYREGRVWHDDRVIDVVLRTFLIEDLLESPGAPALLDPLLGAVEKGQVKIFTPLDSDLYASKGALAMLSDDRNRHLFSEDELAGIDRLLPWTRMMRPGPTGLEDGRRVDLLDYALQNREDLVLKPTSLTAGSGVVLGWDADTTEEAWRSHLTAALNGPYVIQRRIRTRPELFPDEKGETNPWSVVWGVFTGAHGFGGAACRGVRCDSGSSVVNVAGGAAYAAVLCRNGSGSGPGVPTPDRVAVRFE
ncbi:hypothetical protein [Streptomyces sp. B3I8]|uniref:hypothetical protein n=1 Tax=Streptomyces sp. B3I8 TaxID=3042303 RepID=UPI00278298C1|nr:hypothetical protein [Streptomyces sp. B3I8]MDQ0786679.1 hypothetical protein [Streptomyces sp. B3I8]